MFQKSGFGLQEVFQSFFEFFDIHSQNFLLFLILCCIEVLSHLSGQTHYKCIQHKTGSQTRFSSSKSRNNALHADCCKVTIELSAQAGRNKQSVFCLRNRSFAQTLLKLFIMRLPCVEICFALKIISNSCIIFLCRKKLHLLFLL